MEPKRRDVLRPAGLSRNARVALALSALAAAFYAAIIVNHLPP